MTGETLGGFILCWQLSNDFRNKTPGAFVLCGRAERAQKILALLKPVEKFMSCVFSFMCFTCAVMSLGH